MNNKKLIGIDLGTTNTAVTNAITKLTYNFGGSECLPSAVAYDCVNGKCVATDVGQEALNKYALRPGAIITESKRFFGVKEADVKAVEDPNNLRTVTTEMIKSNLAYKVVIKDGQVAFEIIGEDGSKGYVTPFDVAVAILQKVKKTVLEQEGNENISLEAVITVPAYFNNEQREQVKAAGELAGMKVLRIINEPVAAALHKINVLKDGEYMLVCDLGGSTFDLSLLEKDQVEGTKTLSVIDTDGDLSLGGKNIDIAIYKYVLGKVSAASKAKIDSSRSLQFGLIQKCEEAKKKFSESSLKEATIYLSTIDPSFTEKVIIAKHLFEDIVKSTVTDRMINIMRKVIKRAHDKGIANNQIKLLYTGGGTFLKSVTDAVQALNIEALPGRSLLDVSAGAAIMAALLGNKDGTAGSDILLLDVTPLGLGIETLGGIMTVVVPANSTIPTKKSQIFSTAADNQTSVSIVVYQGDRTKAADNLKLGEFTLSDIPAAPRGVPQIEVIFDIDANGIIHVSAVEKKTGKEMKVSLSGKISDEELARRRKMAEENAAYDKALSENTTARNEADNSVYQARKSLNDAGDKISAELKTQIETNIKALEDEINRESDVMKLDVQKLKTLSDELSQNMMKIYESMQSNSKESESSTTDNSHQQ